MPPSWRRWTQPPTFSEPEQAHLARLLHYTLIFAVVLTGAFATIARPLASSAFGSQIAGGMTLVFAILFVLLHRKQLRLVTYLLIGSAYLAVIFSLIFNGGIADEAALILIALQALAGFFLGRRMTVIVGGITAVSFITLFIAEQIHILPQSEHMVPASSSELILALIAVFCNTFILHQLIGRLIDNSQQLQEKNKILLSAQQELIAAKEEAELANRTKSEFLSRLSHDLRTPLNSIIGFANVLVDDKSLSPAAHKDYLNRIQKNGDYMQRMINDLLDLSRIEARKLQLYPVQLPLTAFLMEIVMLIQMEVQQQSFKFVYQFDEALPAFVQTDETRLRQILVNLLNNAIKFTPEGSITFRVRPLPGNTSHQLVRFEIIDTGIGIPPADLTRIFEPFEQLGSNSQREKGAGLGLAISHQLVDLLGGKLRVESQVGRGSRFWFDLPFAPQKKPQQLVAANNQ